MASSEDQAGLRGDSENSCSMISNPVVDPLFFMLDKDLDCITITITADAFLLRMVRNIVGVLVHIGKGFAPPSYLGQVLTRRDRSQVPHAPAPAHGLYLVNVDYH